MSQIIDTLDTSISPFGNNANTLPGPRYASDTFDTDLETSAATFFAYGGRTSRRYPSLLFSQGFICHAKEMAKIQTEMIDEKESMEMGKMKWKTNKGRKHKTSFTFNGAAIYGLAAIIGYDFSPTEDPNYNTLAPASVNVKGDFGIKGALIVNYGSYDRHLRNSVVLTQCRISVPETPGSTESFTINIESDGEHIWSGNGNMFVCENYLDKGDGLIVNGFAPDGVQTVFKMGNGNHSLIGATLPVGKGLPLNPVRPGLKPSGISEYAVTRSDYWFVEIAVNGVPLNPQEMGTFNRVTGELTLPTPPPMGSCLSVIYALPTGYPDFNENTAYRINDIRKHDADYYISTTNNGPGTWNPTDWTLVPQSTHLLGAQYRPHNYGQNVGTPQAPTYPTCMFWSWTLMNYNQ